MDLKDRFKLEIHWEKVVYNKDGVAQLINCYLIGPVLNELTQLNNEDYIFLDFTNQYCIFIPSYYIAKFYWRGVHYLESIIKLDFALLENKYINSVPKLENDDFLIVDTSNHTDDKHAMYLTYDAYLIRYDKIPYSF